MAAARAVSESSPLVLIVEQDRHTREMYAEFLLYSGFRVAEAEQADDAWQKVNQLRPAIVTTGIGLPEGHDGCELCERVKTDATTSDIPVVVVTGWVMGGHIERAKRAGCDAVLLKPCPPSTLVSEIRRLLRT
jgi:two-component system, cell cycle response regulator DivK